VILDLLSVLLIVPVVFQWAAAAILWAADRSRPGITALRERSQAQIVLAIVGTIVAILALNRLVPLQLSNQDALAILAAALLLISVPGLRWLYLYSRDRF
jgi:hypothetical protein